MEAFIVAATEDTPEVRLDPENNTFIFSHRSLPENAIDFYQPIYEWFNNYFTSSHNDLTVDIKLEYFNTASAKQLAKLLLQFEQNQNNRNIVINWYYHADDKDMLLSGNRFAKLIKLNFEFIEH